MIAEAYRLIEPVVRRSSVVFASPHSASSYPVDFVRRSLLDKHSIRSSEDAFVDQLFNEAPDFGAPLLLSGAPRAYVDMNRSPDELDPALIEGVPPQAHNPRVASGLGVIPRFVANGRAIYRGKITLSEAQRRIDLYWRPYHDEIQRQLEISHALFGNAILIDCHSMPHEALDSVVRRGVARPEIVLGDRYGAAAGADIVDRVEAAFQAVGLVVARNTPFAGAFVTQAYGRPSRRQHAIQIEIDRALYMDERRIEPNARFHTFREILKQVIAEITALGYDELSLAAE
ncbi:N-formylglutamate amidohydrolase [Chachezhania antarctica]|uniref:N-formylglutamate amidohydrolase n=1 Tax=Chachezhania antarctica TaxID=2340860 RepID=UPI000EB35804|nr:N-formylglutamate amidohydrolase [Chachezhania antarctica]|tara:strand:+ start:183 stop:1043 length:861 start_codon:yes stop_codon:yes gene_type:complete